MLTFLKIFTWWNNQTFGTRLNTLLSGKLLAKINLEINIIKQKRKRWVVYNGEIEASKYIVIGILGCIEQIIKLNSLK